MLDTQTNPRFAWLQQQVGKPMTQSPSPFAHWLLGTLTEVTEKKTTATYVVRPDMTNPMGMLHGGVIAGIFDDLMGVTFFGLGTSHFYPTVDLSVVYLASATQGETVTATTELVKKGETIMYLEACLYNSSGKLLAKASSNLAKSNLQL